MDLNKTVEEDKQAWESFIEILKNKLPGFVEPWVISLEPALPLFEESENGIFLVKSSQSFGIQVLNQKYLKEVEQSLFEVTNLKRSVRFVLDETVKKKKLKITKAEKENAQTIKKMENIAQMYSFSGLNIKYTFENFVEGENSKFAYNIAKMIAKAPGQKYNPLFISGSVGLGKTHLMQAIGHSILKDFPNLKVRYTKAEEFGNKLIEALKGCKDTSDLNEKMKKFRQMYRTADVLLIDDIQWIEGKKRTEEEIFYTFDALYQMGHQIVFTSDRPISAFELLPDRLKSRFEWGIETNIKVPDIETRTKIVKNYANLSSFPISDEVALFLAETFDTNVRELEGAYNKASAMASIDGVELTIENTKQYLELDKRKKTITVNDIIDVCSKYFSIQKQDIISNLRSKEIINARKFAIFLSRQLLDLSYPVLAKEFKKKHTTIIYQYEKLKKDIETNKAYSITLEEIKLLLKNI